MGKKLMFLVALCSTLLMPVKAKALAEQRFFYEDLCDEQEIGVVRDIWTEDITTETITERGNTLLIEKCIGECLDSEGNGVLYVEGDYNYISYSSVEDVREGDVVLTLFIYNPGNDYEDDIIDRIDYVIDHKE